MTHQPTLALRGPLLSFSADPGVDVTPKDESVVYLEDGLLWIEQGHIKHVGEADALLAHLPADAELHHYPDKLIMPGFVDPHVHFSQLDIIASFGKQLLDWLNDYTFPEEARFADPAYADALADAFISEMLRYGTTTALAFCTSHPSSVDALFKAASARGCRMLGGKVMMDRNAPAALTDTPERAEHESRALIERWHGQGRLEYAITPRFAPTSSPEQMRVAGLLAKDYPELIVQTHLSENTKEIAWVSNLYPSARDYLDVYDRVGLLKDRAVFAHAIHIDDSVRQRLHSAGGRIAFCPTSNLFLGSGLFDFRAARESKVTLGIASDIGAGTSLSQLHTLAAAYQVCQLQGVSYTPWQGFYQVTHGNAVMLSLNDCIGQLKPGFEADIVVLDPRGSPALARKASRATTLFEMLFNLMMLGDDRAIHATYVQGRKMELAP
ncbi:guanine deaminase [Larsenimonas suaedae]|uniref:Guanine deaminase n=1 Tax=Larsenimonas suaedae TaxID=1851019 RepID=A0ABU1GVE1_9GAMM|nr:guanine deaminase [Larsenimonas suaedae]MCM2971291.1 guanine deaminase [Larsenimonas suaedae]MDR5896000.1 guanine deaminase [Larsenimonas suaedae]